MRYSKIIKDDLVNGEGVRVSLFVSGCHLKCPGCFNKEQQDFNHGEIYNGRIHLTIIDLLKRPHISGLSILGGEPLAEENRREVERLIDDVIYEYPDKNIWLWTGYTFDEVGKMCPYLANKVSVLITGRFEYDKQLTNKPWVGSDNQEIWRNQGDGIWKQDNRLLSEVSNSESPNVSIKHFPVYR